jgi:uncharacterized damage-inducible protein DinB
MISTPIYPLDACFVSAARTEFADALRQIEHCVAQLSDEQAWQRPGPGMNSVANLLLHLAGNVRQWIVSGVGGAEDTRYRAGEFADESGRPRAEMLAELRKVVEEADAVIAGLNADRLLERRTIQGYETQVLGAVFHAVAHFRGHAQEITHMTRAVIGDRYVFAHAPDDYNRRAERGRLET